MLSKIVALIGCSMEAAGLILTLLDVAAVISVLVTLTGIGFAAGAAVLSYKAAIKAVVATSGKQAAKIM